MERHFASRGLLAQETSLLPLPPMVGKGGGQYSEISRPLGTKCRKIGGSGGRPEGWHACPSGSCSDVPLTSKCPVLTSSRPGWSLEHVSPSFHFRGLGLGFGSKTHGSGSCVKRIPDALPGIHIDGLLGTASGTLGPDLGSFCWFQGFCGLT